MRSVDKAKRTTIKDVALRAGTSIATVSYVLNNSKDRYITAQMRTSVEEAARELGYVKSSIASGLKGKEMGVIAFLTPQFDNHFFLEIFFTIEKIANKKGYVLSVCNTLDDPVYERTVIERMNQLWVDAYVIIPTHRGTENTAYLRTHGIPVVSVERPLDGITDYDFISSDNFGATYEMTAHLVGKGHTRIALAYWDSPIVNLKERLAGYRQALEDGGLRFDEGLVKRTGELTPAEGSRITREVLSDSSITAVFYAQYVLAEGGIKFLRKSKVQIPERISVCVLGGPKWIEMSETRFAHVLQPGASIGQRAAELIFEKLEKKSTNNVQEKIACELHVGDSIKDLTVI